MKSPVAVKVLGVMQTVVALTGIGLAVYVASLTRSPETIDAKDASETIRGLWIGAAVLGLPSLLEGVLAIALMRGARWAWWIGMVLNLSLAVTFIYSAVSEHSLEPEDVILAVMPTVLGALYFVSSVRRWLFGVRRLESRPAAAA